MYYFQHIILVQLGIIIWQALEKKGPTWLRPSIFILLAHLNELIQCCPMHFKAWKTDHPSSSCDNNKIQNYMYKVSWSSELWMLILKNQFLHEVGPFPRACHIYILALDCCFASLIKFQAWWSTHKTGDHSVLDYGLTMQKWCHWIAHLAETAS